MSDEEIEELRQGQRYSYEGIDIDYLRTLKQFPQWLKERKKICGVIKYNQSVNGSHNRPPGHPSNLSFSPYKNYGSLQHAVSLIADPDNYAWTELDYRKETGFQPENAYHRYMEQNTYYVVDRYAYKRLWQPLPWNHLRMRVWEVDMYLHYSQYLGYNNVPFTYPPTKWDLKVIPPKIDPHWKDEYIAEVTNGYEMERAAELAEKHQYGARYATPERFQAVIEIRKLFPDYQPRLDLINGCKDDPAYQFIEPYRWYYHYASLESMENDPIRNIGKKKAY